MPSIKHHLVYGKPHPGHSRSTQPYPAPHAGEASHPSEKLKQSSAEYFRFAGRSATISIFTCLFLFAFVCASCVLTYEHQGAGPAFSACCS